MKSSSLGIQSRSRSLARALLGGAGALLLMVSAGLGQSRIDFFPGEDLRFSLKRGLPYLKTVDQAAEHVTSMSQISDGGRVAYTFSSANRGEVKITVYDHDTIRVQWHWTHPYPKDEIAIEQSDGQKPKGVDCSSGDAGSYFWVKTSLIEVRVSKSDKLSVDFHCPKTGNPVCKDKSIEFNPSYEPREDDTYDDIRKKQEAPLAFKVKNSKIMASNTAFIGLGDWAGPINRRGHRIQFWNEDSFGWTEYQSPKYTSFPVMYAITPKQDGQAEVYGLFFNNTSRTLFDLGELVKDVYSFEAADGQIDYFFFYDGRGELDGLVDSLTSVTGRSAMLPKWAYGYHMSRFSYTEADLQEVLDNFIFTNTPLSGIFIDLDYMDQTDDPTDRDWSLHQFKWNERWFPEPRRIVERLARRGIRSSIIVEPFLDADDEKFTLAKNAGMFIKTITGETLTQSIWCAEEIGWIDFTNVESREWWKGELSSFLGDYGIMGVWNDLNEMADVGGIPLDGNYHMDGRFSDPADSRRWHLNVKNTHCIYSTKVSYESVLKAWPGKRPFVLGRGGFPGVQRWSAGWSGDNVAGASHLRHNIRSGVSIALCGFSNYGHDIGGFTGHPSFRVLQRWHEWSAFTPLMRNHSGKSTPRRDPFFYSGGEREVLSKTIRSRYYFLPHLYSLAYQCNINGWPMNAPVAGVFPHDEKSFYSNEYDFMVGEDVMVAPVVFEFDSDRVVRLPQGGGNKGWHSFWDDTPYEGGELIKIEASLGTTPLFVQQGGFVAVNPEAWQMEAPMDDNLRSAVTEFHFWGGTGEYVFYDDDGETLLEFSDSKRVKLHFRAQSFGNNTVIQVRREGAVENREFRLVLRGEHFSKMRFLVDGEEVETAPVNGSLVRGERWTGRAIRLDFSKGHGCVVLAERP